MQRRWPANGWFRGTPQSKHRNPAGAAKALVVSGRDFIDFRDQFLEAHNIERAYHGSPPLEWSDELAAHAQKQADACAGSGQLFHGNSKEFGEGQNVSYA